MIAGIAFSDIQYSVLKGVQNGAKNDSIFINTLLPIAFRIPTLKESSVKGIPSPARPDLPPSKALDAIILAGCAGMHKFFLLHLNALNFVKLILQKYSNKDWKKKGVSTKNPIFTQ